MGKTIKTCGCAACKAAKRQAHGHGYVAVLWLELAPGETLGGALVEREARFADASYDGGRAAAIRCANQRAGALRAQGRSTRITMHG